MFDYSNGEYWNCKQWLHTIQKKIIFSWNSRYGTQKNDRQTFSYNFRPKTVPTAYGHVPEFIDIF